MLIACIEDGLSAIEIAAVLSRTVAAVRSYAWRNDLRFAADKHAPLRSFLKRGGRLVREDLGGAVGVRWGRAHRSGSAFDTPICERLLSLGLLQPAPERVGVYVRSSP